MGAAKQPVDLYLAKSLEGLTGLATGNSIKDLGRDERKLHRLPRTAQKMYSELLQSLNDQEKSFIMAKRYLKLMDHVFRYSPDKTFVELRYGNDYRRVTSILSDLELELKFRYEEIARAKEREMKLKQQDPEWSPSAGQLFSRDQVSTGQLSARGQLSSTGQQSPSATGGMSIASRHSSTGRLSTTTYIQIKKSTGADIGGQIFGKLAISPVELYEAILKKLNILVVDTRSAVDFYESHIITEEGRLLNIPENIIVPGLSANTLGQRLSLDTQIIWNRRDQFDVIILLDWDTDSYNFSGSKLERLRLCIVEWDLNRVYVQHPVFLSGGFKDFLEYYPTEVTNAYVFMSQTNSEIDEILTIDNVSYPKSGSGNMNLRIHAISSFADIRARVERDFGDFDVIMGASARPSRSEGQLPKDFYSSQESVSPYKSLSQESLPKDYFALDTMVEPFPSTIFEPGPSDIELAPGTSAMEPIAGPSGIEQIAQIPTPFYYTDDDSSTEESIDEKPEIKIPDENEAQIKSAIEDEKAELLSQVRALKPKLPRNVEEDKDVFVQPAQPPAVDRSFKPPQVQQAQKQGYTGVKNLRNNCYVSCMMQCLKVLPHIKSMFAASDMYIRHIQRHPPIVAVHFASVMKSLWEGTLRRPRSFYPQLFLDKVYQLNPVYAKGIHEDTFEYFIVLFNNLNDDCSIELPRPKIMTERERSWYSQLQGRTSFLVDLFYYQLRNSKICWHCQKPNYVFDSDNTLMLSLSDNKENNYLEYLLKEYLKENLVADYSCADCKHSATIVNRKEIILDPEILVIVLKRYTATRDGKIKKIDAEISFPTDNLEFGGSYYKLYSIPQHSGTMQVGHYYASVLLHDDTNTWVLFNDDKIIKYNVPISEVYGIKSSCVGFFYVRTGKKTSECQ